MNTIKPQTNVPITVRAKFAAVRDGEYGKYLAISGQIGEEEGQVFLPDAFVNDFVKLGVLTGEATKRETPWGAEEESYKVSWQNDKLAVPVVLCKREGENNKKYYTVEAVEGSLGTFARVCPSAARTYLGAGRTLRGRTPEGSPSLTVSPTADPHWQQTEHCTVQRLQDLVWVVHPTLQNSVRPPCTSASLLSSRFWRVFLFKRSFEIFFFSMAFPPLVFAFVGSTYKRAPRARPALIENDPLIFSDVARVFSPIRTTTRITFGS